MNGSILPFQPPLPPVVPTIEGNVDYRLFRDQLRRIDHQLITSGLEAQLIDSDLERWLKQHPKASPKTQQTHQLHCQRALRCNIARTLLNEDLRAFATHVADQQFSFLWLAA